MEARTSTRKEFFMKHDKLLKNGKQWDMWMISEAQYELSENSWSFGEKILQKDRGFAWERSQCCTYQAWTDGPSSMPPCKSTKTSWLHWYFHTCPCVQIKGLLLGPFRCIVFESVNQEVVALKSLSGLQETQAVGKERTTERGGFNRLTVWVLPRWR